MTTYSVQDCGCIALPEELQQRTGLYPGAKFTFAVSTDAASVTLTVIEPGHAIGLKAGVQCAAVSPSVAL